MSTYNIKGELDTARPVWIIKRNGVNSGTKVGFAFMKKSDKNTLWFNTDAYKLEDLRVCNSKERKELIKTWKRILADLEKAPVYEEKLDGTLVIVKE